MSKVRRINLYVDPETNGLIDRLVEWDRQRRGVSSRSEVIRLAIRRLAEAEKVSAEEVDRG